MTKMSKTTQTKVTQTDRKYIDKLISDMNK